MGILETKTFKSGNSIAIRLPREVAFAEGTAVTIEKRGDALIIRPAKDPVEEKRKVLEFVEALKALPRVGEIEQRDTDLPERPGLI
ncbi:MAG: AbrB/MazE/SpoVT family DNA-binding domain-containing protein [Sphingomonas sp.]|nr:AbrB/MazE/SpoVT family DNA-binding domain-containing protein [Sphingomonas sp.]